MAFGQAIRASLEVIRAARLPYGQQTVEAYAKFGRKLEAYYARNDELGRAEHSACRLEGEVVEKINRARGRKSAAKTALNKAMGELRQTLAVLARENRGHVRPELADAIDHAVNYAWTDRWQNMLPRVRTVVEKPAPLRNKRQMKDSTRRAIPADLFAAAGVATPTQLRPA